MIWLTVIVIVLCYYLYKVGRWYREIRRKVRETDTLRHPPKNWLFGNLPDHPGPRLEWLEWLDRYSKQYGQVYRLFHGMEPQIYVTHPDTAKELLRTSEPKPVDSMPGYSAVVPWLGLGLLLSNGNVWHRNRHLLTPAFHFDMLKNYLRVFNLTSEKFVQQCSRYADSRKPVDIFKLSLHFSLDSLLRCAFSCESDVQELGEKHPVVRMTQDALSMIMDRCLNPFLWPEWMFYLSPMGRRFRAVCNEYNDLSRGIIEARKCEIQDGDSTKGRHLDFLEILVKARDEDGKGMTDDEIRAEVNTFLFAGHDTTASATSWTLYRLALHPEHQEKCRKEIGEIFAGRPSETITWDDVAKLNYVTMCIKETMRLHTVVPVISRKTVNELKINGHRIPKGVLVNVILYLCHRQPDVWPEPEMYDPNRFHPDEAAKRNSYDFVPFSAGPRNCIGQNFALNEVKVAVVKILQNFRVGVDETRPPKMKPVGVMSTENGLWLTFERIAEE